MSDGITRNEYFKSRIEQLKDLPSEELNDRMQRGKRAQALIETEYYTELNGYIQGKIEEFKKHKMSYSVADRFLSEQGKINEIGMIQYESQVAALVDLLDQIKFHVDDGKVASAVLKLKEKK